MKTLVLVLSVPAIIAFGYTAYLTFFAIPGSTPWLPVTTDKEVQSTEIDTELEIGVTAPLRNDALSLRRVGDFTHHYSKRHVWNVDESLILTSSAEVLNIDGSLKIANPSITAEAVWSNVHANIVYAVQTIDERTRNLVSWNVDEDKIDLIHQFDDMDDLTIGQWEGTVSNDDKAIVLFGIDNGVATLVSYSLEEKAILGTMEAAANFNWAGVSQLGKWILVENNKYPDPNAEIKRYNLDFSEETVLIEKPNHGDFCFDAKGNEVYAMAGRYIYWVELDTGLQFRHSLPPENYGHLSCRATERPGWAYISANTIGGSIGAVPLIENFQLWEPWGTHRSTSENYMAQPKASVSRSGRAVLFSSNWLGDAEVGSYEISLDTDYVPGLSWKDAKIQASESDETETAESEADPAR